jgi:hypothetical protein
MHVSDFVCEDHQQHASDCGCTRNICPKHRAELTPSGGEMVCLYCEWPDQDDACEGM